MFQRFHYERNISLQKMQAKADSEGGLCCYEWNGDYDTPFMEQVLEPGDQGEVVIFEGEVWGLCVEGPKAYPFSIVRRIPILAVQGEQYMEFVEEE